MQKIATLIDSDEVQMKLMNVHYFTATSSSIHSIIIIDKSFLFLVLWFAFPVFRIAAISNANFSLQLI